VVTGGTRTTRSPFPAAATTAAYVSNFLQVTPAAGSFIRVEYYAQKTSTSVKYGARWTEFGGGTQVVHEITPINGAVTADGINHTFLVARRGSGPQWDVFYDFHLVGTTAKQTAGTASGLDVGIETNYATALFPSFDNRVQYMTTSFVLQRLITANTAVVNTLGACGTTYRPPVCFATAVTGSPTLVSFSVSKPATLALAAPSMPTTTTDGDQAWTAATTTPPTADTSSTDAGAADRASAPPASAPPTPRRSATCSSTPPPCRPSIRQPSPGGRCPSASTSAPTPAPQRFPPRPARLQPPTPTPTCVPSAPPRPRPTLRRLAQVEVRGVHQTPEAPNPPRPQRPHQRPG
jgi:hypothetical protein